MTYKIERIHRLNDLWRYSIENFQFYRNIAEKKRIYEINNLKDWGKIPLLTKEIYKNNSEHIIKDLIKFKGYIKTTQTGGSSSKPTSFPQYPEDIKTIRKALYGLRKKAGLDKLNKDFIHIWGHSHLINKNFFLKPILKYRDGLKRFIKNEKLISGYNPLSDFDTFINAVKSGKYSWIIGYTTAVYCLARHIKEKKLNLRGYIKYIILTTESISSYYSDFIEEVFNCKVIKEYGLAEIGVIAYSSVESDLYFFETDNFYIEKKNNQEIEYQTNEQILITTFNKVFPLIRYCPDDTFKNLKIDDYNNITCSEIFGRAIEGIIYLPLKNGNFTGQINEMFIVHCLKTIESISQTTCYVNKSKILKKIRICYTGKKNKLEIEKLIIKTLNQEVEDINMNLISIEVCDNFLKTIAGKSINYIIEN